MRRLAEVLSKSGPQGLLGRLAYVHGVDRRYRGCNARLNSKGIDPWGVWDEACLVVAELKMLPNQLKRRIIVRPSSTAVDHLMRVELGFLYGIEKRQVSARDFRWFARSVVGWVSFGTATIQLSMSVRT